MIFITNWNLQVAAIEYNVQVAAVHGYGCELHLAAVPRRAEEGRRLPVRGQLLCRAEIRRVRQVREAARLPRLRRRRGRRRRGRGRGRGRCLSPMTQPIGKVTGGRPGEGVLKASKCALVSGRVRRGYERREDVGRHGRMWGM